MMDIQEFHKYNKLVLAKQVEPLAHDCDTPFVTRTTVSGDVVLYCASCNSYTQPGLKIYDRIVAVNKEFYLG